MHINVNNDNNNCNNVSPSLLQMYLMEIEIDVRKGSSPNFASNIKQI